MKTIGVDARLYFQTGVGVYLRNFLTYLEDILPSDVRCFVYVMKEDSSKIHFRNPRCIKRETTAHWHTFAEQLTFLWQLYQDKLDLMHFTYFSYPMLYRRPFIATIHDATPLLHVTGKASTKNPLWFAIKHACFRLVLSTQVKKARVIITPTQTVKDQLIQLYGNQIAEKITPLYEGVNQELMNAQENDELAKQFPSPFFLYVGNFYPHKNVSTLVKAFAKVSSDAQLLLVGPSSYFSKQLEQLVHQLGQEERIRFYPNATHSDLVFFYKHALALINPSVSEGFGLPLVEASFFHLPVIASDIPVFHELLGSEFMAFHPSNISSVSRALQTFLEKKPHFDTSAFLKRYSFEAMTHAILRIYQEALQNI